MTEVSSRVVIITDWVQSPACPWEYYISEELHCSLLQQQGEGEGEEMKAARVSDSINSR